MVAGDDAYREAKDFMRMLEPSHAKNVKPYKDSQPLLTRYGVESQLDAMFSPTVQLQVRRLHRASTRPRRWSRSTSTRAGRRASTTSRIPRSRPTARRADEVARQLRLRDLAGLIVIDFIDMDEKRNNRTVERRLKEALKNDRARIQVGRISHFGLMEMSRQRIRSSVLESSTEICVQCGGTGHVRSVSSVALQLVRSLEEMLIKGATHNLTVRTKAEAALYVLNHKRALLQELESRFGVSIMVQADATVAGQLPFVIDRGEQVQTLEAARARLAQTESAPAEPEEEEVEDDVEDDAELEHAAEEPAAAHEHAAEDEHPDDGERHADGERHGEDETEGGVRRRRRRRRGRRGEPRENGADHAAGGEEHAPAPQDNAEAHADAGEAASEQRTRRSSSQWRGASRRERAPPAPRTSRRTPQSPRRRGAIFA